LITSETGGLGTCHVESADFFKIRIPRISGKISLQGEVLRHLGCKGCCREVFPLAAFCGVPKGGTSSNKTTRAKGRNPCSELVSRKFWLFFSKYVLYLFFAAGLSPLEEPKSQNISLFFCWHDWKEHMGLLFALVKYSQGNSTLNVNITRNN